LTATSFIEKLNTAVERNDSLLCIGLDPDPGRFPAYFPATIDTEALFNWGQKIIEATADQVCCYKPNFAFYEQHGPAGLEALRQTIAAVPNDIPVLLDVKRGDIGSTAAAYARAAFDIWGADAATVNPYLGQDSVKEFTAHPGKTAFVLAYTSNPSAATIQEFGWGNESLYEHIVRQSLEWGETDQIGFVVGATQPEALARIRRLIGERWILLPGSGAQGGQLDEALAAGLTSSGRGLIVSISRSAIYSDDPRAVASEQRQLINQGRRAAQTAATSAPSPYHDLILGLHENGCVQFGQFTLASGQQSPIYIDLRRIGVSPKLLQLAARAYADHLTGLSYNHLAAVPYAGMPIGTAIALLLNRSLIYPRKEVKAYGLSRAVEGVFAEGETAVVIEDVVTSGGSVQKAIETLEGVGLRVKDAVVLIDREQGGEAALADKGYTLHAALRMPEILATLHAAGRISTDEVTQVRNYLAAA
jgi:uridine monophosphate synthetase